MGMIVSWMLVAAAIGAFAVTALSGCFVIPALHKLHFGQTIRESGPTWHNKKQGTPTMGGLCFIFGILVACGLVYAGFYRYAQDLLGIVQVRAALLALFLAFGSGFIGFLDDYIKVVKHRNLGLLAWQKLIMQFIVTGGFLVGLHMQGLLTTIIMLPFIGAVDLGWVYYPIAFFGIIFLVNAVNLTDGLDGLCSCVTFVSMLGYLLAASMLSFYHVAVLAAATAAAAAGFLVWNFYPAKVFMGDTGSMFLGGMVTALAFIMGRPRAGVLLWHCVYLGRHDRCDPARLLQADPRQAHFPHDTDPPRIRDARLERSQDRLFLQPDRHYRRGAGPDVRLHGIKYQKGGCAANDACPAFRFGLWQHWQVF